MVIYSKQNDLDIWYFLVLHWSFTDCKHAKWCTISPQWYLIWIPIKIKKNLQRQDVKLNGYVGSNDNCTSLSVCGPATRWVWATCGGSLTCVTVTVEVCFSYRTPSCSSLSAFHCSTWNSHWDSSAAPDLSPVGGLLPSSKVLMLNKPRYLRK